MDVLRGRRLCGVEAGSRVKVLRLEGEGALRKRLMEMGIIGGTTVIVKKLAPLGDPMQITVNGCEIAIRKSDAAAIIVEQEEA